MVVFKPLSKENLLDIAELMLKSLKNHLKEKGIDLIPEVILDVMTINDSSVTASYEVIEDPIPKYFGVIIVLYLIYLAALFFFSESFKKLKPRWITKAVGDSAALISSAFF